MKNLSIVVDFYLVNNRTSQVFNNNTFILLQIPECCFQTTVARAQKEIFLVLRSFFMVTTDKSL